MKFSVIIGNHSDVGRVREVNEDYYGSFSGSFGELVLVCDGLGGYEGGAIASQTAVETIKEHFESLAPEFNPANEIEIAIQKANDAVRNKAASSDSLKDMGSTVALVLIQNSNFYTAHLGDSRIYLVRDNEIEMLTKDHSFVQQMVDANIITREEALTHPKKNVITRSLGGEKESEADIAGPLELQLDDKLVLCSDGLSNNLSDDEIRELVISNNAQDAALKLVGKANEKGGSDNITVQVIEITSEEN